MKVDTVVEKIYPEVEQLTMFAHPKTKQTYRFLSNSELIQLAERSLERLLSMGIKQIIVSESGAVPFAKLCASLSWKRKLPLVWYAVKIPRDLNNTFQVTLATHRAITKDEMSLACGLDTEPGSFSFSRESESKHLPDDYFELKGTTLKEILASIREVIDFPHYADFLTLTNQSELACILHQPFIFFDEYIDSGKTLFQTFRFFKLFNQSLTFKIFSYLIKLPEDDLNPDICRSLYTLDNEFQAYQLGVYPFENRLDWLGYFYFISPHEFKKIGLSDLCSTKLSANLKCDLGSELLSLDDLLSRQSFLNEIKITCVVPDVANFIKLEHLMQFSLYNLEQMYFGVTPLSEFLYQLFDLYGPIWSPLPDSYHMSYLDAFETISPQLKSYLLSIFTIERYQTVRAQLIPHLARLLEERRIKQQHDLIIALEQHHED